MYCSKCGSPMVGLFCGACGVSQATGGDASVKTSGGTPVGFWSQIVEISKKLPKTANLSLHWGWVAALSMFSMLMTLFFPMWIGFFVPIWVLFQWNHIRTFNQPEGNKLLPWMLVCISGMIFSILGASPIALVFEGLIAYRMISAVELMYKNQGHKDVKLNGFLAAIFAFLYIQFHFTQLANERKLQDTIRFATTGTKAP